MLSSETRKIRSRLANAARLGDENLAGLRTAYDVSHAIDVLHSIRGTTTPEQQQRLHEAVDATGGESS